MIANMDGKPPRRADPGTRRNIGVVALGGITVGGLTFGGLSVGLICIGGMAVSLAYAVGGGALAPCAFGGSGGDPSCFAPLLEKLGQLGFRMR